MTLLQRRFKAVIERLGDTFNGSSKALVSVLDPNEAATYLTSAQIGAAIPPVRAFHVPYDDATSTGATLTWNGASLTVLRAVDLTLQNNKAFRMLIAA